MASLNLFHSLHSATYIACVHVFEGFQSFSLVCSNLNVIFWGHFSSVNGFNLIIKLNFHLCGERKGNLPAAAHFFHLQKTLITI